MNRYVAINFSTEEHNMYIMKTKPIFLLVIPLCKIQIPAWYFNLHYLLKGAS